MASLFKRGNGTNDADEMRAIVEQMQLERHRYEALLERGHTSEERLEQLGGPIARATGDMEAVTARLAELEQRFTSLLQVSQQVATLDERAVALTQSHEQAQERIVAAVAEVERMRAGFGDVATKIEQASHLEQRLDSFLEVDKPFLQLHGEAEELRGQVEGTGEHLARLREQQDRLLDMHKLAMAKMEALDRRREDLSRDLQDKERRVAGVEQAVRGMDGVQHTVDGVKRDMGTLKALGEMVAQKSAALEAQRAAVESALSRADDLERAMRQINAGVQQQQDNEKSLAALQEEVAALRSLHESVIERSGEITQLQREADEQVRGSREELSAARDEMKKTIERFDFESRGLESVSQRVTDLRQALSDFEHRFQGLSESAQTVSALKAQTQSLTEHLQTLIEQTAQVDGEVLKLTALRRDLDETSRTARDTGALVERMAQARPEVEAALGDVEKLRGTHAAVRDALEQAKIAREEIARAWESQSQARSWLGEAERSLTEIRGQISELHELTPVIEAVKHQALEVGGSIAEIEARRDFVDELEGRVSSLGTLGEALAGRVGELGSRMAAAEQRFAGLAEHSEEAEQMTKTIAGIGAGLTKAERKSKEIAKSLAASDTRCEAVEGLAERTRALKDELDQRQQALEQAARELAQCTTVRAEAAATAEQLEEMAKRLATALGATEKRAAQVGDLTRQLEDRAAGLKSVDRRLLQFEERLTKWELVEEEIARSLEQISARQSTVESLQADLDHMVALAEKTSGDVRTITSAHRDIEEGRKLLDEVMGRLREIQKTTSALDERKRQLAKAEDRLARAEALLVDVRSSMEALQGQKVIVDEAVEKAGSLRTLVKQAEAASEGLREERRLTARVRAAVGGIVPLTGEEEDGEDVAQAA